MTGTLLSTDSRTSQSHTHKLDTAASIRHTRTFCPHRNMFYFLFPSFWKPSVTSPKEALAHVLKEDGKGPEPDAYSTKDEDVMAEESATRSLLQRRSGVCLNAC